MTKISNYVLIVGTLMLTACGGDRDAKSNAAESRSAGTEGSLTQSVAGPEGGSRLAQPAGQLHSGTGDITEVSGNRVSISHGPVATIGWPAMTMTFRARDGGMLQGLNVGDPVEFSFRKAGDAYVLTSIRRTQ